MSKFYYHGVGNIMCNPYISEKMINIIKSGGLKSKKFLNLNIRGGYNGMDYVSVCKKEEKNLYEKYPISAFYQYIHNKCCFIISDEISAIKTKYITEDEIDYDESKTRYCCLLELVQNNEGIRYSDMFDEYQVYESIDLEHILGIGLPLDIYDSNLLDSIKENIKPLCDLAISLGLDIVDTRDDNFVEKYEEKMYKNNGNKIKYIV